MTESGGAVGTVQRQWTQAGSARALESEARAPAEPRRAASSSPRSAGTRSTARWKEAPRRPSRAAVAAQPTALRRAPGRKGAPLNPPPGPTSGAGGQHSGDPGGRSNAAAARNGRHRRGAHAAGRPPGAPPCLPPSVCSCDTPAAMAEREGGDGAGPTRSTKGRRSAFPGPERTLTCGGERAPGPGLFILRLQL